MKKEDIVKLSGTLNVQYGIVLKIIENYDAWSDVYILWSSGKIGHEYDLDLEVISKKWMTNESRGLNKVDFRENITEYK